MSEQENEQKTPEEWMASIKKRTIYAFVSGILIGVGFVVTVLSVAMFVK